MRLFSTAAQAALERGDAITSAAVRIDCLPDPVRVWGGFGVLTIGSDTFTGIGDRGLASVTGGALGGADQVLTLQLDGVEPDNLALLDMASVRRAPTIVWRLIFDSSGRELLEAEIFRRGRLDQLQSEETAGGEARLRALIQGAARGLGRSGGRMRSNADQQLVSATDRSMRSVSFAGSKRLYWAGRPPAEPGT